MNYDLLEARYRELLAQRQAGLLAPQKFEEQVGTLRTQDAQQRWWQLDPASGQWLMWDGSQWQPGTPPRGSASSAPLPAAAPPSATPGSGADKAAAVVQTFWHRFLARLISPGEFLRQSRLPLAQRSQGWWDVAGIAGGALSGYIWFLYSSIRGMPHLKLLGMSGGRNVWYDFLPSLALAAIPLLLFVYRGKILARLDRVWARINASLSYAMQLGAAIIVGAMVLNYFSPALLGWAFAFREGLDFTTPLLMVGIPVLLAIFRSETDQLLQPLQPVRQSLPKFVLIGIVLAVPYAIAFVLYRTGFNQYELLHWNLALGTLIPYALMRSPPPAGHGHSGGATLAALYWMLPAMLILYAGFPADALADDCMRDLFNMRDCLRTGGYAEIISGTASGAVSVLVNGPELVRILILPPGGQTPQEAPPAPPPPEDIEWTAPDGRHNTLTWDAAKGGYINILTGGFVAPQDVENWKQNIGQTIAQTDEWRAHNAALTAAGLDAQSQALAAIKAEAEARAAAAARVSRIQQAALKNDLWNPGGPGDVVSTSNKILDDIWAGKPIDQDKIDAMHRYVGNRISGAAADASTLKDSQLGNFYGATEGLQGTLREALTGKDADGNSTLAGTLTSMFGRVTAGVATGGVSEVGYVAANTGYAMKDAADRGASDLEVFKAGLKTGVLEAAPTVLGAGVTHYFPKAFPNVAQGVSEMMKPVENAIAAVDSAVQKGAASLGSRVSRVINPIPSNLAGTRAAVDRVLAAPTPKNIATLYSNGGMDRLAVLQKANGLSAAEAKVLNKELAKQVNSNINTGMKNTISQFEKDTGVGIDHAILGDSGSTARSGGNPKIKTDFDRTQVTKFNQKNVAQYAEKNGLTVTEANAQLQEKFGAQLTDNIDTQIRSSGFSHGATDLDYKTYNGIGKSAGQADAYPPGFTGSRQAVQGGGTIYERGPGGDISTRNISGQAVVDQHGLNTQAVTGTLPENPTRFGADEFHDFSTQQMKSVTEHSDVKSLAKAMGRESDLAGRIDRMASNPTGAQQLKSAGFTNKAGALVTPPKIDKDLMKIAAEINKNPSEAMKILHPKYTEQSFAAAVKQQIGNFHAALPSLPPATP